MKYQHVSASCIALFSCLSAHAATATFEVVDTATYPLAISQNGVIATTYSIWSVENGVEMAGTYIKDISNDGELVLSGHASLIRNGSYESLPETPEGNMNLFKPYRMSNDGKVIVGTNTSSYKLWTEAGGYSGNSDGSFKDVSPSGQFLISYGGTLTDLENGSSVEVPRAPNSARQDFTGVSDNAVLVGSIQPSGSSYGTKLATMWDGEVITHLGGLLSNDPQSQAMAISANGEIVVGYANSDDVDISARGDEREAFIWDAQHGLRSFEDLLETKFNVDLQGWKLTAASVISNDGYRIAGIGIDPNGNQGSWMVTLTQECVSNAW